MRTSFYTWQKRAQRDGAQGAAHAQKYERHWKGGEKRKKIARLDYKFWREKLLKIGLKKKNNYQM